MFIRFALFSFSTVLLLGVDLSAQKPKEPLWSHAFDLAYRKLGESEFKDDQKFGVEVFKDNNTNLGVYISQAGSLGLATGFEKVSAPLTSSRGATWISGLDMPCRKYGVSDFDKATVHCMETFHDANTGAWVYITDKAILGVSASAKVFSPPSALKGPQRMHSMDLRCRTGGNKEWKDALKFGVEVYKDVNTGNLVYICSESGAIAIVADAGTIADKNASPDWLHGLDLKCRKHNEPDFTATTRKLGIEVFRDGNTGNYIYLSETGAIAVAGGGKDAKAPSVNVKEPAWSHGLNLKCRKTGEKSFTDKTQVFGCEVFRDDNTGVFVYIAETGSIAVAKAK